jgi:hypothetical protein
VKTQAQTLLPVTQRILLAQLGERDESSAKEHCNLILSYSNVGSESWKYVIIQLLAVAMTMPNGKNATNAGTMNRFFSYQFLGCW